MVALHQWHHSHFGWLEITVHCALHQRDIKSIPGLGPHQPCCKEARLVFLSPKHSSKSSLWSHHQNRTEKYQVQPVGGWADPWALRNILGAFLGHWSQQQRWTRAPGDDEKVWRWFNDTMTAPRDSILAKFLWSFCCPRGHRLLHDSLCTWKLISINIDQYLDLDGNIHQINVYFAPTFNHTICSFLSFKMYMLHRIMFANL